MEKNKKKKLFKKKNSKIIVIFFRKHKRDIDVIRENHKFLWNDEEPRSWEEQLAKKYYDRLYKEYCICDLTFYKEGKVALRWQIEAELVSGKGQFICGNKNCDEKENLKTWEVNFGYIENYEKKNALVKLRLCSDCSEKLNYKHKRKEIKRKKKRKHRSRKESDEITKEESVDELNLENESKRKPSIEIEQLESNNEIEQLESNNENNIWKNINPVIEEKSRDEDFEEFIEQLLL
ncbi:hypothetical protein PGB90_001013 [Kerria lacca]